MNLTQASRQTIAPEVLQELEMHLQRESHHLDRVISFSRDLQKQLHRTPSDSSDHLPGIFASLQAEQGAINDERNSMVHLLHDLPGSPDHLTAVISRVDPPAQLRIRRIRGEIVDKLETVRSITLGSQMVLYYTLDFYQRLLRGISGAEPLGQGYSPAGRTESPLTGQVVERHC